jgi:uncharacterized membrane protein YhaH (DUF805 family)
MEFQPKTRRARKIHFLEKLLTYEISTAGGLFLLWFLPIPLKLLLFGLIIIAFLFFIIAIAKTLFDIGKYGWLAALLILVVIPLSSFHFIYSGSVVYPYHYIYPIAAFALYSIVLRGAVEMWEDRDEY